MNKQEILKMGLSTNGKEKNSAIAISGFNVWINDVHILNNINLHIPNKKITCIIGPSGGGKSTLIRSINRINDEVPDMTIKGNIQFNGKPIYAPSIDVANLRTQIGMVFQKPCVFPKSIKENVLFGVQHLKKMDKHERLQLTEENLKAASLWKEVAHRLNDKASSLSLGQQQRLCIARTLAVKPKIILLDEPTSSLDPVSARAIENMMLELKEQYTIVFVTHNIQQAKRIADHLVFICEGKIIEQGAATKIFAKPSHPQTRAYLNDEFCEC